MFNINKEVNMTHLETWLGQEKIDELRRNIKNWYGEPICILDLPGSVWLHADGTFTGKLKYGFFSSALDYLEDFNKKLDRHLLTPSFNVGFSSISDALLRASSGYSQRKNFNKTGVTGVTAVSSSLWASSGQPGAGAAPGAAPGGTVHVNTDSGSMKFTAPSGGGTNHLVGADVSATAINNSLLFYDRLFAVAKTMNSTATEAVTGVPTRYQSTTTTDPDFCGGNFLFVEVGTALAATAHNWTVCKYTDDRNTVTNLPSFAGSASAITQRLDHPTSQWFATLDPLSVGVKNITQMQCSATVATGTIAFVIGHPIGFMSFPIANIMMPFDWLTNRDQAPRIYDNACLTFLEMMKPTTTASSYSGRIYVTGAA